MKPLQAAVSLQAADRDLPDDEVAVMCASHNGEPVHVETVRRLLSRAGLDSSALRCPPGWPLDQKTMPTVTGPRPELHNCSGKHAGMLLACVRSGWDTETYREPDHPLQARIHQAVLDASGLDELSAVGVDGCGVPVHGMPLSGLATLFSRMARPEHLGELAPWARRAVSAMLAEPYLVAGRDRVDTAVMGTTGDVAVKAGAEGLLCAAAAGPGLGIAVKIQDGSSRGTAPALIRALFLLGLVDEEELRELRRHARPPVLGGGRPVGEVVAEFDLDRT
jgi:L-asparaginase II